MSIGLYDMDMATYRLTPFNLELMKTAAYYKRRGEIVILSPQFIPDKYTKFFIFKDYDNGEYPPGFTQISNCKYYGLAFSNNKYMPLDINIEKMKPDTSIYSKAENLILQDGTKKSQKIWQNLCEAEHCRLSLDGKNIWDKYESQFKHLAVARNLIIHDYDLGQIKDSFYIVKDILSKARTDGWATRIGTKFPINISTGEELLNWSSLKPNSIFYSLSYHGIIPDDAYLELVGRCRERACYTQLEYNVTDGSYGEDEFIKTLLPKIFKQVIISRSYKIKFSLKYDEEFFKDPRWGRVIDLLGFYQTSYTSVPIAAYIRKIPNDCLIDFARAMPEVYLFNKHKQITKPEVRELFYFVKEKNPELFDMFYHCNFESLGG